MVYCRVTQYASQQLPPEPTLPISRLSSAFPGHMIQGQISPRPSRLVLPQTHLESHLGTPESALSEGQSEDYLWGYVVWGPAEGAGGGPWKDVLLTHAKVSDFNVALGIQHDVVQLQVPGGHAAGRWVGRDGDERKTWGAIPSLPPSPRKRAPGTHR